MAALVQMAPFALLRQLEQLGRSHEVELPEREAPVDIWEGVGFRLGGRLYVAAMSDITELLKYPELSVIPRTRPWVRGMANVRGNLLPVMDLNGYLGGMPASVTRTSRILIIDIAGVFAGLLVDEVFGMRHIPRADFRDNVTVEDPLLGPLVRGAFVSDGETWLLFDVRGLVASPRFMKVAI